MASPLLQERPLDAFSLDVAAQPSVHAKIGRQKVDDARGAADDKKRARQLSARAKNLSNNARSATQQRHRPGLPVEVAPGSREGKKFTVTSIGTNGMLYLRYVCCTNVQS